MFSILSKSVTKIFGTKSDRDIKAIMPLVEQIKAAYALLSHLSDDELLNPPISKRGFKTF
jgi:preprotein translocase subunit SecA